MHSRGHDGYDGWGLPVVTVLSDDATPGRRNHQLLARFPVNSGWRQRLVELTSCLRTCCYGTSVAFAALGSFSCGFAPLGDARELLNVRFAVTGLLFLVFDLEVHFALAWTFDATTGSWQLLVANWLCWASLIGERESCWSFLRPSQSFLVRQRAKQTAC